MTKTLSKWEWLEHECLILGYTQSADYARLIEEVLKGLYGDTMTKNKQAWFRFQKAAVINGVTATTIVRVMQDPSFCIACERTPGRSCEECLFRKTTGGCDPNPSSLYGKFAKSLCTEAFNKCITGGLCALRQNKVMAVQDYLRARGINVSEIAIVNAAIDIARRLGAGDYTFVCEFEERKE